MTREQILERLRAIIDTDAPALTAELRSLSEAEELDETQQARFDELVGDESPITVLAAERRNLEQHLAVIEAAEAVEADDARVRSIRTIDRVDHQIDNIRAASRDEVRDAALKSIEVVGRQIGMSPEAQASAERAVRSVRLSNDGDVMYDGNAVARRLLYTERPAYRSAFMKATNPLYSSPAFTPEEMRAIDEMRVDHQSLTSASGGYGVPVLIDPTIILTTGAADTPILRVARVETITTNEWKGVSSTPTDWAYFAEGATSTDDDITLAQPTVTTHMARSFVRHTIEIGMDYPNFAAEFGKAISAGYIQKIASQSMTGSGSAPQGIFTAIDANSAREVIVTTDGALGPEDVFAAWNALGELWRGQASWFSSVSVESQVRKGGGANMGLYSVDLTADGLVVVNGRPWYKTDYAPAFTGTTGAVNLLVVGDFSNYLIAQRAGMSVETVPHIFDVTNNRPTGERGLFAWARHGMDSINDAAFTLLKNKT